MPREGHGSRNLEGRCTGDKRHRVMPREGHGSRNDEILEEIVDYCGSCPARGMGVEMLWMR